MLVICELVVEKGVDVAAMSDDGITALIAAASEGHAGIVELLLEKAKADPDAKDKVQSMKYSPKWLHVSDVSHHTLCEPPFLK